MITKRGKPISGSGVPRRKPYVLANQAETSQIAQRQIRQPDLPQQDPQLRVPAPTNRSYRSSSDLSQFARSTVDRYGAKSVREMADPDFEAVGYERSATKPNAGNPIISGYPTRGSKRQAGMISTNVGPQVSKNEMARLRQHSAVKASMSKLGLGEAFEQYKRFGG
jgi:hypothetical protein